MEISHEDQRCCKNQILRLILGEQKEQKAFKTANTRTHNLIVYLTKHIKHLEKTTQGPRMQPPLNGPNP
jgi:hypothetical protein